MKDEIWEIINDKDKRIYACENSLYLFSLVYFTKYHHFIAPEFHKEMYKDLKFEDKTGIIWEMFRESAKTTLAKIGIIHKIVYKKKHFITWTSFDQKKAEGNLFDVALELQTNDKIIADFGQLFYEQKLEQRQSTKKSIGEFITANSIKVKAYSVGQAPRGEVYMEYRPDFAILDDIETSKTIISDAKTENVISYIDELLSGLAGYANILVLANRLTDNGSINYLKERVKNNPRWRIRSVAVEEEGKITWPDKYARTNKEAEEKNQGNEDATTKVISLEAKKEDLGETVYNREMLNRPLSDDEREFKWSWLQNYYDPLKIKDILRNRYITIDVADSKEREDRKSRGKPDYTGTTVVDWDIENTWYVVYAKRKRMNAPELIDWIFYLWQTYKPIKIGVEKKAFEDQVRPYIKLKGEETGIYPVVEELEHGGTRKEDRIRGALQGRAQAGKIKFLQNAIDNTDELKQELYDFPRSKFDDLSDALAYIQQLGNRPIMQGNSRIMGEIEKEFLEARGKLHNKSITRLKKL